jgi:predicted nucleic acid-binding protein
MSTLPEALVLDCTVTIPWYLTDEASPLSESLFHALGRHTLVVPVLWRLEFVSAMRAAVRRGRIPPSAMAHPVAGARLPLQQDALALDVAEIGQGCAEFDLTPYDYVYLALARQRRLPLATFDGALVRACRLAGVEVMTQADRIAEPGLAYPARPSGGVPRRAASAPRGARRESSLTARPY